MFSLSEAKRILNQSGNKYTEDQVRDLLQTFDALAEIEYQNFMQNYDQENDPKNVGKGSDNLR